MGETKPPQDEALATKTKTPMQRTAKKAPVNPAQKNAPAAKTSNDWFKIAWNSGAVW